MKCHLVQLIPKYHIYEYMMFLCTLKNIFTFFLTITTNIFVEGKYYFLLYFESSHWKLN